MSAIRRFVLRLLSLVRSRRAESDLAREINAHLQLLEDTFIAQGMSAEDAHYAARRAFGGVEQVKEHQREARSFRVLDESWLDIKLGARMLIKYPGLTVVGGFGMAVAVAIAAAAFTIISSLLDPTLPLEEGERIVSLQNWDTAANDAERRIVHDFLTWRDGLRSVEDVGAFRTIGRNLIAPGGPPETVRVAEISASGFTVARVPPLMGRYLIEADERERASFVVVIGYDVWRNRFAADPDILGKPVQLGDTTYSVVGVMPEGFAFPVNHRYWVPLRMDTWRHEPRSGPELMTFARLAAGVIIDGAQSELTTIGQRASAAFPNTHAQLRPQVLPYAYPFSDMEDPENALALRIVQVLVTMLLVVVCVNVAILVYAHGDAPDRDRRPQCARREPQPHRCSALHGSLVLATAASLAGLGIATIALRQADAVLKQMTAQLPFWITFHLSSNAVLNVVGLTLLAATIVGVLPGLKATGRAVQTGLRIIGPDGSGSGMGLGRTWTLLIVAQVAFAVALLPGALFNAWHSVRYGVADPGFATKEFLTAQLVMDRVTSPTTAAAAASARDVTARYADRSAEVLRRVGTEAGISDVTYALDVPGVEATVWIEAEGVPMPTDPADYSVGSGSSLGLQVRFNHVDVNFFEVFEVPLLMGRGFRLSDADPAASAVIVNRALVQKYFVDGNVLGRRIRYVGSSGDARQEHVALGRWYEIVGVVTDFPANPTESHLVDSKVYHAAVPGPLYPVTLALRLRGSDPATFSGRLRDITAAIDPNLQLREILTMDEVLRKDQGMMRLLAAVLAIVTMSVVLLSSAGIYAMMSFAVSQRRREIGIRAALGADSRRILGSIFSRALGQLAVGAVAGVIVATLVEQATNGELMRGNGGVVLPLVALFMMMVGLVAAFGPARRGLRVDPIEALRE